MKNFFWLAMAASLAFAGTANAQVLTLNDDTSASNNTWTFSGTSDFNTNASGVSTISTNAPGYTTNIGSTLTTLASQTIGLTIPANLLANTGAGWVLHNTDGIVVISANAVDPSIELADPFVAYSYSFFNSSGSGANFSMTFSSSFTPTTYNGGNPDLAKASFGYSLTDGSPGGTGVSASPTQTATLSLGAGPTTNVGVDIAAPIIPTSISGGDSVTVPNRNPTSGYTSGPSGTFDTLTVTVSGSYSSNAELGVTGRVDVVPEPSTWALILGGLGTLYFFSRRRQA